MPPSPRIAVLIPCKDEAASVASVVEGFRTALPGAEIYVYDNASTDGTASIARDAGATVRKEPQAGKGRVVKRMFADVEADIYVLADGDATYDPRDAPAMIEMLIGQRLDMVTGARVAEGGGEYRRGHEFGNRVLTGTIAILFNAEIGDMLSGYRVMSRRLVKSFPAASAGFEIETELTVHAQELGAATKERPTTYRARPEGSQSKLSTWRDGARILLMIANLYRRERPNLVFGGIGVAALAVGAILFAPVLATWFDTGLVPRFPSLVAASALGVVGIVSIFSGLVLSLLARTRRDVKRLAYLAQPPPPDPSPKSGRTI